MKKTFLSILIVLVSVSSFAQRKDTLNADNTINIYAFGALVNGINDDLPAWQAAVNYATSIPAKSRKIKAPNGVSRLTGQIIIGGEFLPLERFYIPISSVTTYPAVFGLYLKGAFTATVQIVGESFSCIYADFNDTTKLQSVFYLGGVFGERGNTSVEQYNLEISNLGIYAQGYFKNGLRQDKVDYSKNNVIAIASAITRGLSLHDLSIIGFKDGQVLNNTYYLDENNVSFSFCQRASYDVQSHSSTYKLINVYNCGIGMETRSNRVKIEQLYATLCKTGLYIGSSDVEASHVYIESCLDTEGQLTIGDDNTNMIDNIIIKDLTIAGCNPTRNGIYFKSNVRSLSIEGARVQSQFFKYNNPATRVYTKQISGTLPPQINIKQIGMDSTGKMITL